MSRLIDIDKAKEYCEKIAASHTRLATEVLSKAEKGQGVVVNAMSLESVAYFWRQADIYRHDIPAILEEIYSLQEGKNGD